ncbi:MAG TPA: glycosyltransferase [Candidatus Binataceae bacterium]|nr:glycosyltransferase [Candidatus Binataceae bacterium]
MARAFTSVNWAILIGQYGGVGGVSDYTTLLAADLTRAGDQVSVYASFPSDLQLRERRFKVVKLDGSFTPGALAALDRMLESQRPDRVLVQYVPHTFGRRAINVRFCLWLYARRHRYPIWVMFHEVAVEVKRNQPLRRNFLGAITHLMAFLAARAAQRIFVAIPAWELMLKPALTKGQVAEWLPVPSNIPVVSDVEQSLNIRKRYVAEDEILIGHFGTYGQWTAEPVAQSLVRIMNRGSNRKALLLGAGSSEFRTRLADRHPSLGDRLYASGALEASELSLHLSACDLMVQPYPDGVCTRRGSVMACLAHGLPIVTTSGRFTEPIWRDAGAALFSSENDPDDMARQVDLLTRETATRKRIGAAGKALYDRRFALNHTIEALRSPR